MKRKALLCPERVAPPSGLQKLLSAKRPSMIQRQRTRPRPSGRFDKAFRMSAAVNSNPDFLPLRLQHGGNTPNKQEREEGKIPHS